MIESQTDSESEVKEEKSKLNDKTGCAVLGTEESIVKETTNVEFKLNNTNNKARYGRKKHSSHVFASSLRSGKFWLRVFRPWKWRKRHHKECLRRVTSDLRQAASPPTVMPSSFSALEPISTVADMDETYRPEKWGSCNFSVEEVDDIHLQLSKEQSSAENILRLTAEEMVVAPIQKVVIIGHKEESASDGANSSTMLAFTGHFGKESLENFEEMTDATEGQFYKYK
ncbi:unnamed protein product [Thelazia callipaeda]|uniref:Ovate family protein n=1 Tax=Thelazia callipaeda TaxID=103827 RepID=A0A0N5D5A6_THECL|nr:unnamed protein product [Thelazia callipaeda]